MRTNTASMTSESYVNGNGVESRGKKVDITSFQAQVQSRIDSLLQYCADGCSARGLSSLSCSIYDTAWVSMISRVRATDGRAEWVFPSSFQYLLAAQLPDGGWGGTASDVDPILTTMAALLSIKKHQHSQESNGAIDDLHQRAQRAKAYLTTKLQTWDVQATDHVGFELLIPTHLRLLEEEGLSFRFPGREALERLREKKLSKWHVDILYSAQRTTMTHSLEAFVGQVDFSRLKHLRSYGSMMGSPASTAAYLIYGNEWDDEAEEFLRSAMGFGQGMGSGAVPSAFPTTIFEATWIMSTLLKSGCDLGESSRENVKQVVQYLEDVFNRHNGLVGFATSLLPDADDTAMTVLTLNMAGVSVSPQPLIDEFRNNDHFFTYKGERNPSFSANCNVLNALLHTADPGKYINEIELTLRFLYKLHDKGELKDKWNISQQYSRMLFANALARLVELWAKGRLPGLSEYCIQMAPLVLVDITLKTLQEQQDDGSWGHDAPEITAYAILTLAATSNTLLGEFLGDKLRTSLVYGRAYLEANMSQWKEGAALWVEKVSYRSPVLSETYCIAAMRTPTFTLDCPSHHPGLINISHEAIRKFAQFYSQLPLFSREPHWRLNAALVEAYMWLPRLAAIRADVFPRENMAADRYLEYIPQTWTLCNAANGSPLAPGMLWEMMVISMLNYQVDEFLESVVGGHLADRLDEVRRIVCRFCTEDADICITTALSTEGHPIQSTRKTTVYVERILRGFTTYILTRPAVLQSPPPVQRKLRQELQTFLLAHLTQIEDSQRLQSQKDFSTTDPVPFLTPRTSYFRWVHSVAADHTSCPYSFQFLVCLIAYYHPRQAPAFQGVRQEYLAEAMCRHLATMCRQYNDYGSIARDCAEGNLNSVNFPEFWASSTHTGGSSDGEPNMKGDLMWIAEFERDRCMHALERLCAAGLSEQTQRILKTFIDVTDLYGQIYVVRDIASRVKT